MAKRTPAEIQSDLEKNQNEINECWKQLRQLGLYEHVVPEWCKKQAPDVTWEQYVDFYVAKIRVDLEHLETVQYKLMWELGEALNGTVRPSKP